MAAEVITRPAGYSPNMVSCRMEDYPRTVAKPKARFSSEEALESVFTQYIYDCPAPVSFQN